MLQKLCSNIICRFVVVCESTNKSDKLQGVRMQATEGSKVHGSRREVRREGKLGIGRMLLIVFLMVRNAAR
jgi:hypothetical protein